MQGYEARWTATFWPGWRVAHLGEPRRAADRGGRTLAARSSASAPSAEGIQQLSTGSLMTRSALGQFM